MTNQLHWRATTRQQPVKTNESDQISMRSLYPILFSATLAVAQTPIIPPQVYSSGAVGIAPGQTAKWSVVNVPLPLPLVTPTCSATLSFLNEQGQELKTELVRLAPKESRSISLNASTDLASGRDRTTIHAMSVVPITGPVDEPPGRLCALVHTMEVIDNETGKTAVLAPGTLARQSAGIFSPFSSSAR